MKTFLGLKSIHARLIAAAILAVGMSQSYAALVPAVTVPNTFTAGTPAVAADVNTNFSSVATQVNTNFTTLSTEITALQSDILQTGHTLTGVFTIEGYASVVGQRGSSPISFPLSLATPPIVNFIPAGGAPTAACPGSSANPTATAGNLCVYESYSVNISAGTRCIARTGGGYSCGLSDIFGTSVYVNAAAVGQMSSVGSWAVTAP